MAGYNCSSIKASNIPKLLRYASDTYTMDCYGYSYGIMSRIWFFLAVNVGWTFHTLVLATC
jgi:hypothetical protein